MRRHIGLADPSSPTFPLLPSHSHPAAFIAIFWNGMVPWDFTFCTHHRNTIKSICHMANSNLAFLIAEEIQGDSSCRPDPGPQTAKMLPYSKHSYVRIGYKNIVHNQCHLLVIVHITFSQQSHRFHPFDSYHNPCVKFKIIVPLPGKKKWVSDLVPCLHL